LLKRLNTEHLGFDGQLEDVRLGDDVNLFLELAKSIRSTGLDADDQPPGHTRSDGSIALLLDHHSLVRWWLDVDPLAEAVLILDAHCHLDLISVLDYTKSANRRQNIDAPLE